MRSTTSLHRAIFLNGEYLLRVFVPLNCMQIWNTAKVFDPVGIDIPSVFNHGVSARRRAFAGTFGIGIAVEIGVADIRTGSAAGRTFLRIGGGAGLQRENDLMTQSNPAMHVASAIGRIARFRASGAQSDCLRSSFFLFNEPLTWRRRRWHGISAVFIQLVQRALLKPDDKKHGKHAQERLRFQGGVLACVVVTELVARITMRATSCPKTGKMNADSRLARHP